jgi:hypothetical protein
MRRIALLSLLAASSALAPPLARPAWAMARQAVAPVSKPLPWKSPFRRGLARLTRGPLLDLGGKLHVDARQYRDLSAATQHLLSLYPPASHYFVGLGRDPAPIIAFLQNLGGKELAINFPASSCFAWNATAEVLAPYVKRFIPEEVLTSGKTIVFVDVSTSGRGLDHYVPLIEPSLQGRKFIKAVFGARFYGNPAPWKIYTQDPGDKRVIDTAPFPEVNKFFDDPYEDVVAEYPRHAPGFDNVKDLDSTRPEYQQYRDALMQRMQRDPKLHRFLTKQGFGHDKTP